MVVLLRSNHLRPHLTWEVSLWEVPISLTSDLGTSMTENPIDIAVVDGKLRIYCLPDQHNSTLYVYDAA